MDKKAFILGMINAGGLGLEIGPSFNPLVPKRDGFRVKTLDYAPREVLVANYRAEGMPQHQLNAVEVVDYVWTGEPLPKLVGDTRFDYIVASHVSSTRPISSGSECPVRLFRREIWLVREFRRLGRVLKR